MHRHHRLLTTCSLAAAVALGTLSTQALADKARWTMTTTWPDSLALIEADRRWVDTVHQIAGDEIEIEFRAGGTLMPGGEVFDATETGSIDAAGETGVYWAGRSPAFALLGTTASLFNAVDYLNWIQHWGGFDLYQEVYNQFNIQYLPYAILNNETGFIGRTKIETLADIEGKRLRLGGRDQGRILEQLGGSQVTLAGGEIYQAIERGVVDGAEFSSPGVDFQAGFAEVANYWSTPGWHQSATVLGVMINKDSWDALSEETQEKLKLAAQANLAWSISHFEQSATEGTLAFQEAGVEISQLSEEELARIQEITNEVYLRGACEDPMYAKVLHSMLSYMDHYANWRDLSAPFNMSRTMDNLPSLEEIEACL
ncbi:TRAP transporter substrate-binding protein DctP [Halomonas campaniensis]|uniref:TRAP transporter substrate-binding protein DctP n=1 Tax=Halomonas campaniensis TaxID=213554 RepID=UPI0035684F08